MIFFAVFYLRPLLFVFFLAVTGLPLFGFFFGLLWLWSLVGIQLFLGDLVPAVFVGIPVLSWILGAAWLATEATEYLIFDKMPLIKTFKTVFFDAWSFLSLVVYWLLDRSKKKSA